MDTRIQPFIENASRGSGLPLFRILPPLRLQEHTTHTHTIRRRYPNPNGSTTVTFMWLMLFRPRDMLDREGLASLPGTTAAAATVILECKSALSFMLTTASPRLLRRLIPLLLNLVTEDRAAAAAVIVGSPYRPSRSSSSSAMPSSSRYCGEESAGELL